MGRKKEQPLVRDPDHHDDDDGDDDDEDDDEYEVEDDDDGNDESIPLTRRGSVSSMVRVTEMSELLLSSPTKDFHSFAEFLKHRSFWNLRDPSWGCLSPFHLPLISILALFCGL